MVRTKVKKKKKESGVRTRVYAKEIRPNKFVVAARGQEASTAGLRSEGAARGSAGRGECRGKVSKRGPVG